MEKKCPSCNEWQFSLMERAYVTLYGHCWEEDKHAWKRGELTLEEFEAREERALNESLI